MPGPSVGKKSAAMASSDRWSLVVSSVLILGLGLAAAAMVQTWRTAPPDTNSPSPPPKPQSAVPEPKAQALAIRLPPPPLPASSTVSATPPEAHPPRPVAKPRIVVPLQRTAATKRPLAKPRQVEAVKLRPLKPAASPKPGNRAQKKIATEKTTPKQTSRPPVIIASQHRKTGGALLRLLEHGKGPSVEIAWPLSVGGRQRLFGTLTRCYGMRPAVLAKNSRLFNEASAPGQSWEINRDRYSGFIRSPRGEPIAEENRRFAAIARRHDLSDWRPVRVFPRAVDAILLGGLGNLLGARYQSARQIRAVYELRRTGLRLTGFQIDGDAFPGAIILPTTAHSRCD